MCIFALSLAPFTGNNIIIHIPPCPNFQATQPLIQYSLIVLFSILVIPLHVTFKLLILNFTLISFILTNEINTYKVNNIDTERLILQIFLWENWQGEQT